MHRERERTAAAVIGDVRSHEEREGRAALAEGRAEILERDEAVVLGEALVSPQSDVGRATPLPLNNNLPMAVVRGDQLYLIGGEIGAATLDGVHYGHHPDLFLIGTIRPLKR